jgi:hypothetical protein
VESNQGINAAESLLEREQSRDVPSLELSACLFLIVDVVQAMQKGMHSLTIQARYYHEGRGRQSPPRF